MKITKVRIWKEDLDLTKPYTIAFETFSSVENLFVVIELENGLYGVGAGAPSAFVTGEKISGSLEKLQGGADELFLGKDIRHFPAIIDQAAVYFKGFPAALAACDIALHDAFTRLLEIPLANFWGVRRRRLPTSITIGILPIEETLNEARERLAEGFRVIKLKTGKQVDQDIATFARLREEVGTDVAIRVDANQGYTIADLQRFVRETKHLDVEFIEQPFPRGQLSMMHSLPDDMRLLCAADEDLHNAAEAVQLIGPPHPYGIFNIKLMKCGGLSNGRRIAQMANEAGIELMWGCMDESIVSITAALHLALASPATRYIDLDGSIDLARDVVQGGFVLEDGYLSLGEGVGLGVNLL